MNERGIYLLTCAIIKTSYDDLKRYERLLIRKFKRRHTYRKHGYYIVADHKRFYHDTYFQRVRYEFKYIHQEYKRLKKFLYSQNIWFDYLDINVDYFVRLMEEQKHDNAADRQSDFIITNS